MEKSYASTPTVRSQLIIRSSNKKEISPDIWSIGHRNPPGTAVNPATKQLWIHEMGPWHGDAVNVPEPSKNYGWLVVSNGDHYDGSSIPDHAATARFVKPNYYWYPAVSPSGIIFYIASRFTGWSNNVILGGISSEVLVRLTLDGNHVKAEERVYLHRIRDVIEAPNGFVRLLTDGKDGELLRLMPAFC